MDSEGQNKECRGTDNNSKVSSEGQTFLSMFHGNKETHIYVII